MSALTSAGLEDGSRRRPDGGASLAAQLLPVTAAAEGFPAWSAALRRARLGPRELAPAAKPCSAPGQDGATAAQACSPRRAAAPGRRLSRPPRVAGGGRPSCVHSATLLHDDGSTDGLTGAGCPPAGGLGNGVRFWRATGSCRLDRSSAALRAPARGGVVRKCATLVSRANGRRQLALRGVGVRAGGTASPQEDRSPSRRRRPASLFAWCGEAGAAGRRPRRRARWCSAARVRAARRARAFQPQIADDLLRFEANASTLGKRSGPTSRRASRACARHRAQACFGLAREMGKCLPRRARRPKSLQNARVRAFVVKTEPDPAR